MAGDHDLLIFTPRRRQQPLAPPSSQSGLAEVVISSHAPGQNRSRHIPPMSTLRDGDSHPSRLYVRCANNHNNVLAQPFLTSDHIYHALINALNAHMIHINLNMIFYTHVEHSSTKNNLHERQTKNKIKNKKIKIKK